MTSAITKGRLLRIEPPAAGRRVRQAGALFLLIAVTLAAYWPLSGNDFIVFDDGTYVTQSWHVRSGLSWRGAAWAFTTMHGSNWHPLTWLSHMLDVQLFGLNAGRHHLVSLGLHAAGAAVLLLALAGMTGKLWPSFLVASLFAVHPLHVESVAWIAERKDVLAGLFFSLTLLAYGSYVRRPGPARYLGVAGLLALGLMAKPMLVTTPFVLLLLDIWPLGRRDPGSGEPAPLAAAGFHFPAVRSLLMEKVPLLLLSAASSLVTLEAQRKAVNLAGEEHLWIRVTNAAASYLAYARKMLWPDRLAVFYPLPTTPPSLWSFSLHAVVLLAISLLAVRWLRARPYLAVGWFWYLGMLVPVIGLVQVGNQAMADRYTYLPLTGLFLSMVWGLSGAADRFPRMRLPMSCGIVLILAGLSLASRAQVLHWRNTLTLFSHTVAVTPDNYISRNALGLGYAGEGKLDEAIAEYNRALKMNPSGAVIYNNLGVALGLKGRFAEAAASFSNAIRYKPDSGEAHNNLGIALERMGRIGEALFHYQEALRLNPDNMDARVNLEKANRLYQRRGALPPGHPAGGPGR